MQSVMQQTPITLSRQSFTRVSPSTLSSVMLLRHSLLNDSTPLPLANTRTGNIFNDRFNPESKWYLPQYQLAADTDSFFAFTASQSGVDNLGNPFNKCMLTLGLQKLIPDDVQAAKAANPQFQYNEIPISNFTASLSTTFVASDSGQNGHNNYAGKVTQTASGSLQVTFDNIISSGVIILYNNLLQTGAAITISYTYDTWMQTGFRRVFFLPQVLTTIPSHPVLIQSASAPAHPVFSTVAARHIDSANIMANNLTEPPRLHPIFPHPTSPPVGGPETFQRTSLTGSFQLSLDNKYNANAYTLKFTIGSSNAPARPIININDLTGFNVKQSEFTELKIFGDIRQKYPSMSRLYIGSLSKSIIVIPVTYSIVRSVNGLSALCQALVDSGSGSNSSCKFQFTFTIAPAVSSIELLQLSHDISIIPEVQGYTVALPSFLKEGTLPKLLSAFQSSTQCSATSDQHFFALGIEIEDQANDSPAVASANMLLSQLCQDKDPFLLATLSLKLDDNFPDPVETNAVLNFHKSTGTDDLTFRVDNSVKGITFLNNSPFDLLIKRYALGIGSDLNIFPSNLDVTSSQNVLVPLTDSPGALNVLADSEIAVAGVISKADIENFIAFQTQNVQSTKFNFGINAASVDFDTLGIKQIDVLISINELPTLSIPQFSLVKLHAVDSSFALIPIQNAISSLQGIVLLTIHFADSTKADEKVTLQHQFIDMPILILQNADISP
jgi:hypothetical protein